jgi:hypothetical protein
MKSSLPAEVSWFVSGREREVCDARLRMTRDGDARRVYRMQGSMGYFSLDWAVGSVGLVFSSAASSKTAKPSLRVLCCSVRASCPTVLNLSPTTGSDC